MMLVTASVAMGCVVKSASVKPAWKELAYTRAARVPRARRARRWVRPPSGGQSPVAAALDACAAAGTARRALRRPCLLIEVGSPAHLPWASRAGKPRLALDYLSPFDCERAGSGRAERGIERHSVRFRAAAHSLLLSAQRGTPVGMLRNDAERAGGTSRLYDRT